MADNSNQNNERSQNPSSSGSSQYKELLKIATGETQVGSGMVKVTSSRKSRKQRIDNNSTPQ